MLGWMDFAGYMVVISVNGLLRLEPMIGLEPTTVGLQNRCSAIELHRHGVFSAGEPLSEGHPAVGVRVVVVFMAKVADPGVSMPHNADFNTQDPW